MTRIKLDIDIEELCRWTYQVQRAEEVVERLMGREHAWLNGSKGSAAFAGAWGSNLYSSQKLDRWGSRVFMAAK